MTSLTEFFSLVLLRLVFTAQNMPEYEFSLTRIFVSGQNHRLCPYTKMRVRENSYSVIFSSDFVLQLRLF